MTRRILLVALVAAAVTVATPARSPGDIPIQWVNVGDAGNTADTNGRGSVADEYAIGTYEVTNSQYAEFLNAVAASDPKSLYNTDMASGWNNIGGIVRIGSSGSYTYSVRDGYADKPVVYVSYYDALRFANWMHNGQISGAQGVGTTETGAYDLTGAVVVRSGEAQFWLPSENEWYKAAYYKSGGTNAGYWDYATQSNSTPTAEAPPGTDPVNGSANWWDMSFAVPGYVAPVGSYVGSDSAYGTYDQTGNVWEWCDTKQTVEATRVLRGGSFYSFEAWVGADFQNGADKNYEGYDVGFRLATLPQTITLGGLIITKFNDLNRNGQRDAGEPGLANWEFHVTGPDGYDEMLSTDENGQIVLPDLPAGEYTIEEVAVELWKSSLSPENPVSVGGPDTELLFGNFETPEPATMAILAAGGLALIRRRRRT